MSSTDSAKTVGQVKWFNNKTGYGFITVREGEHNGKDIFTHFSAVNVSNSQYKYLVQGEYVEFDIVPSQEGSHEFQSSNISGIKGGPLMCETRTQKATERGDKPSIRKYKTSSKGSRSSAAPVASY